VEDQPPKAERITNITRKGAHVECNVRYGFIMIWEIDASTIASLWGESSVSAVAT